MIGADKRADNSPNWIFVLMLRGRGSIDWRVWRIHVNLSTPRACMCHALQSGPFGLQPRFLTTFFKGFTQHVAHATWNLAPCDRRHQHSTVPSHQMSRLPSGSARPFWCYSRNLCLCWPLSRPSPTLQPPQYSHWPQEAPHVTGNVNTNSLSNITTLAHIQCQCPGGNTCRHLLRN